MRGEGCLLTCVQGYAVQMSPCGRAGGRAETMFQGEEDWSLSFAGCGFSSLYYLGALSGILEHAPHLVQRAAKISGASSGCLIAASLVFGIPIETCCERWMSTALEARRHRLSVLHPTFSLLRELRGFLHLHLPPDAHLCASGRLCVSLTRVSDGQNVLVSQFDSREEVIQALLCSCFFPVYCGFVPPVYRGVRYMDGALSNNMPLLDQRNTLTVSPFCGEADICPRDGPLGVLALHYGDLGIQVSLGNVDRVFRSFFPPEPEKLAEMSHNGYMDALCFLRANDLLGAGPSSPAMLAVPTSSKPVCCVGQTPEEDDIFASSQNDRWWVEQDAAQSLPASIQKVLCEACTASHPPSRPGAVESRLAPLVSLLLSPVTWSAGLVVALISVMVSGFKSIWSLMTSSGVRGRQIWDHRRSLRTRRSAPERGQPLCEEEMRRGAADGRTETSTPASSPGT